MKASIIIPVYYNQDNLEPLYEDLLSKVLSKSEIEWEIIMINDGSGDHSLGKMRELSSRDKRIRIISLSKNFGSHAAILCGLKYATGDCAVIKAADLQEPSELILEMIESWNNGNNVVLAAREGRDEARSQVMFSNMYYKMVRKLALPNMPKNGFDVYLIDRKVIDTLVAMNERNSALTGQILWSGFRTGIVFYQRKAREIGTSRWTLKKKIRLVTDTLFSFSTVPIKFVTTTGALSFFISIIWAIVVLIAKLTGSIDVQGWTLMFIFSLFSFGVIMLSLGILGEYLWRTFDASRNRPPYIVEDNNDEE